MDKEKEKNSIQEQLNKEIIEIHQLLKNKNDQNILKDAYIKINNAKKLILRFENNNIQIFKTQFKELENISDVLEKSFKYIPHRHRAAP
ncbi:MAG: hypothetical protein EAX96_08500 [Candidatus Lokiarchaeota archaeon]|nr:hypothetical protein [Candidatus Lokiarchaeota archaeon]